MKNHTDWSLGCEPEFDLSCNESEAGFLKLRHSEFYSYDYGLFPNYTIERSCVIGGIEFFIIFLVWKEIGRGSGGIVYKGKLSDDRIADIKRLINANHREAEFLAEVNTIGKLNHMNLIDLWGYCVQGKHKLLV
ncbi:hypothetical protein CRYUN_Cryun28dG0078900 [Craigia yunnanensis]